MKIGSAQMASEGWTEVRKVFDLRAFLGALLFFSVIVLFVLLLGFGFYLLCVCENVWGFAIIVGTAIIGGSIAIGFGL